MSSPRPLRIVHLAATSDGAPWMTALMREQKRLGHDVAAIIPSRDGNITAQLASCGIPVHAAGVDVVFMHWDLFSKAATLFRLVRLLRQLRPDVVHSHIVNSVVTARLASWLADVPMHFAGNVHPYSMESDILRALEIGTAFCDAATIASCTHTRDLMLRHGVPAEQVKLIHYAVDQSGHDPALADGARVRQELGIASGTPVIGKIAYFYPPARTRGLLPPQTTGRGIKGHDVLLRAAPRVLEHFPEARFVLVGRGWGAHGAEYEQELRQMAVSLGVGQAVLFPGERRDVPDVLAAFDISVHCSLSDNLAGTVESLLMEKPLVVSDIPGFRDTVMHEQTGLVVPADDPAALADAILRLLRHPEFGRRLGRQGRQHCLERFTLAITTAKVERLIGSFPVRAEQRYRLPKSVARAVALPFRLAPVMFALNRAARGHGLRLRRYLAAGAIRSARRVLSRAYRMVRPVRT